MSDVAEKVKKIIVEQLGVSADEDAQKILKVQDAIAYIEEKK